MEKEVSRDVLEIRNKLRTIGDSKIADNYKRYLKSPYDFYGIRVPVLRRIAKEESMKINDLYSAFNLFDELWNSGNHEEMELGIFILQVILKKLKKFNLETWDFMMKKERIEKAKSWDHIDALSSGILGYIILTNPNLNNEIKQLANSSNSWLRRISVVSQCQAIKKGKIQLTLLLAEKLCYDEDIYVQKGTGWMLRECAKKNPVQVQEFIKIHRNMKANCFSYATEKMPPFRKFIKNILEEEKGKEKSFNKASEENILDKIKYFK